MNIENYFDEVGQGSPLVFVHGSYASTSTWKKWLERLAHSHHCITIKLPGHCGLPDPADMGNANIATELDIIQQVVARVTDQPIHLVGHSYGAVVALEQALNGSIPLSRLTLYEPVAAWVLNTLADEQMNAIVEQFVSSYRRDVALHKHYACGQVIDFWGGEGAFAALPNFIRDGMQALVNNNIRHWDICMTLQHTVADLQQLSTPTDLVCGSRSNAVAHAITNHLHAQLPNSNKYSIAGASHFLVNSHVDECLSVLVDV